MRRLRLANRSASRTRNSEPGGLARFAHARKRTSPLCALHPHVQFYYRRERKVDKRASLASLPVDAPHLRRQVGWLAPTWPFNDAV